MPAGYTQVVYEPQYVLSADKKRVRDGHRHGRVEAAASDADQPDVLGRPGQRPAVIKVASAYEAATHHRVPPPRFGPVPQVAHHQLGPLYQRRFAHPGVKALFSHHEFFCDHITNRERICSLRRARPVFARWSDASFGTAGCVFPTSANRSQRTINSNVHPRVRALMRDFLRKSRRSCALVVSRARTRAWRIVCSPTSAAACSRCRVESLRHRSDKRRNRL